MNKKSFVAALETHFEGSGAQFKLRYRNRNLYVVMDGGLAQKRVGEQVLKRYQLEIPVLSVVKDERHKPKDILGLTELAQKHKSAVILANAEAHRFSITFHKKKRSQAFLPR